MKFLRQLLEDLETLNVYTLEVFDRRRDSLGEIKVIAASEEEAKRLALHKARKENLPAVHALVVDVVDVDAYDTAA